MTTRLLETVDEYHAWLREKDHAKWRHANEGVPCADEYVTVTRDVLDDPRAEDYMSGDGLAELDVATGAYELVRKVRLGDVVLDVGAHVGHFARSVANRASKVYAVEPQPRNYRQLVKLPGQGQKNVEALCAACWNESGRLLTLKLSQSSVQASVFATEVQSGECTVMSLAIDDLCLQKLDFMKIDCEGAEALTLHGARETLKRCRPFVAVEVDDTASEVQTVLDACGYRLVGAQARMNDPTLVSEPLQLGLWHCEPKEQQRGT